MLRAAPTLDRSIGSRRCLRLESLEDRCMLSHPAVAAVNVSGTGWASSFISYLQSSGAGNGGYAIPVGSSAQLQTLPWNNINQIRITFSEDVKIEAADLSVSGVNKTAYTFSAFSYDSGTFTAVWTLDAPIAKDKLLLDLDADGMDPVVSVSTHEVLDGAWTDSQSTFNSGNGQGGADFQFRFNVLPGDADGSGVVSATDSALAYTKMGKNAGDAGYDIRCDINGSGGITSADIIVIASRVCNSLPTGDPVGMTDDAPTTAGISDVSVATSTTDYVLSLPDLFEDAETASDQLTYSIVGNTNASLFNSLNIDSSGELDLSFAGSIAGDAEVTVRATDASGLVVDTTFGIHRSAKPFISDFYCVCEGGNQWTISGTVTDNDDSVEGYTVELGGVLASYHLTANVASDGVFVLTVELVGLQSGTATAQTTDPHGVLSNLATDTVIV